MDKEDRILNDQEVKDAFVSFLSVRMSNADWYYNGSDDPSVWHKGHDEIEKIVDDLKALARLDKGLNEAKKLWDQHPSSYTVPPPKFFSNPKLLNNVLDGLILKDDARAAQKILLNQQKAGNRFVVFGDDPLMAPKRRFTGFPSRIEAENFAYEKSTWEERYHVLSIAHLQTEIKRVLEPDKRFFLSEVEQRLRRYQLEQDQKCSRGNEISR